MVFEQFKLHLRRKERSQNTSEKFHQCFPNKRALPLWLQLFFLHFWLKYNHIHRRRNSGKEMTFSTQKYKLQNCKRHILTVDMWHLGRTHEHLKSSLSDKHTPWSGGDYTSVHCQKFHKGRNLGLERRLEFNKCLINMYWVIKEVETTQVAINMEQGTEINCKTCANLEGVPDRLPRAKGIPCIITLFAKMKRTKKNPHQTII